MREVNRCDFCGEGAAGTFEVVPPERDPTDEGRRMVLCEGCRDTLGSVLEPILGGNGDPGGGTGTTTVVAEPEREPTAGVDSPTEPKSDESVPSSSGESGDADGEGPARATDAPLAEALESGCVEGMTGAVDGEGVEGTGAKPRSARRGTPPGYRKVMRFLENRDFPMDREEAETLAAEAYGVDRETVSATIDHAVKHNRLREASGKLFQ